MYAEYRQIGADFQKDKWVELGKSLRVGISLIDACRINQIPIEEAEQFIQDNSPKTSHLTYEMKKVAEDCLETALQKLKALVSEGPRVYPEGVSGKDTDLEAAKELAKLAMATLKIHIDSKPDNRSLEQKFLGAVQSASLWEFKKPG